VRRNFRHLICRHLRMTGCCTAQLQRARVAGAPLARGRAGGAAAALALALAALGLSIAASGQARAAQASGQASGQASQQPAPAGAGVNLYALGANVYGPYQGGGQIRPWHVQGEVWLLAGEPRASNVAVQIGDDGVLVVDTGAQSMAPELLAQIQQLAREHAVDQGAIRFVVNTNGRADHIGGNAVIRAAGSTIAGAAGGGGRIAAGEESRGIAGVIAGAAVIANQNVLTRLVAENAAGGRDAAQPLWPTDTEDFDLYNSWFNGEAVRLFHPSSANTDGQLMVQFRRSDVIAAGDVIDMNAYPVIDVARGGTIDGELVALNHLIDLAVPAERQEGGTVVIPGHGRLCDQSDVVHYKDMLTVIRNRVQFYRNQGKTLQQVLALGVTADYEERWGASAGAWTTTDFVTAVYRTLSPKGPMFSMRDAALVPAPDSVPGLKLY
jgi:glyoxylase-like metal-dependent hydrolase (beta-lactamase superfamily II)